MGQSRLPCVAIWQPLRLTFVYAVIQWDKVESEVSIPRSPEYDDYS
jgi:hypothetical protein